MGGNEAMAEIDNGHEKMKSILEAHGIVMDIDGCGCCGSPAIYFEFRDEVIVDSETDRFKMTDDDDVGGQ